MSENISEVTPAQRVAFVDFWTKQRSIIEGVVDEKALYWFGIYTSQNNIGYEIGNLRPGKHGQWDLFGWLTDLELNICDEATALFVAGLTAQELSEQKRLECLRGYGVNPDNPVDVARHQEFVDFCGELNELPPKELDKLINRLEKLLGFDPV